VHAIFSILGAILVYFDFKSFYTSITPFSKTINENQVDIASL
jgi:hypothetical protein